MDLMTGILIVGVLYLLSQSGVLEGVTAGTLGPGGTRTAVQPSTRPGGGGGAGAGAAAAVVGGLVPIIRTAAGQIRPGSVPSPPTSLLQSTAANPVNVARIAADSGLSLAEFGALAGQFNMTPSTFASAIQAGSGLDIANTVVTAGELGADTAGAVGSQFASIAGWALPVAAALAIGGMILKAALSRRGSFGESKDRARAKIAQLPAPRAYQSLNAILDSLLTTGRMPVVAVPNTDLVYGFESMYENIDSFKDVFVNAAAGTEMYPGLMDMYNTLIRKASQYYSRVNDRNYWWNQVLGWVGQADESWGRARNALGAPLVNAQTYLEELGRSIPPPEWLRGWSDFLELASLGYEGMLRHIRQQIDNIRQMAMTAGEGGNA